MHGNPVIRCGRLRNRLIAALVPTFLLSGMPAVACSCSTGQATVELLASVAGSHASYCRCESCPGRDGGECCCCKPHTKRKVDDGNLRCRWEQQSAPCVAVLHERLLTSSTPKVADDLAALPFSLLATGPNLLADSHAFWQPSTECDTGPPPLDLVVALRRFLI
jgi:hypothetical protein